MSKNMVAETASNVPLDGRVINDESSRGGPDGRRPLVGILDREIRSEEFDAFGHKHFAEALGSMIEAPAFQPPYSIGLLGRWGTGKSSVKSLYQASVSGDRQKKNGRTRVERFRLIGFNAWRYGGEDIRRALLRHVFLELGGEEERWKDVITRTIQNDRLEPKPWRDTLREGLDKTVFLAPQFVLFAMLAAFLYWFIPTRIPVLEDWPRVGLAAIPAALLVFLGQQASGNLSSWFVSRYRRVLMIEEPQTSAEEYEGLLVKQLAKFKQDNKKCERIVVFVDDLDRLSAEEMVTGLDAIRTFMELPANKLQGIGIVFVISCDEEKVASALSDRQRQKENPEAPGALFTISDARKFLDRIFQFRLEIPPFPPQDLRYYAKKRLAEDMHDVADDLQRRDVSLDDVIDRLIPPDVQDPRTAVQSLNTFAQSWWVASQREFAGAGSNLPGGLQEGAVTNHPIALAALCALKISFPDFYASLLVEPRLIQYFTSVFLHGASDEIPDSARLLLQRHGKIDVSDSGRLTSPGVYEPFRPLRQYIASVQSLHWPASLQPLLLLSQDPVTRKHGDRAPVAFNALASGDAQAVLEALSRHIDSVPLTTDEARLLRGMQEDLERDTPVRRINAAAAVASLVPRLADTDARQLLTPVSRQLVNSPELRYRVGIDGMAQILPRIGSFDRTAVAGKLVEDLFRPEDDEILFQTTTNQPMTLDEAMVAVNSAAQLVLSVWEEDGLQSSQEQLFLAWMMHRTVSAEGRTAMVPFKQLDTWVATYERRLLPALGEDYVGMWADEIEAGRTTQLNLPAAFARARVVLDKLAQEDRQRLWELLSRLISLQSADTVALAREVAEQHRGNALETEFSTFMQAFAFRLDREDNDQSEWGLIDWKVEAEAFLELADSRQELISQETWSAFKALAISWSNDESSGDHAVRLLELLYLHSATTAVAITENWIGRATVTSEDEELADSCRAWIGLHFSDRLNDKQREQLQEVLTEVVNRSTVTEKESQALQTIVLNLSVADRRTDDMQELVKTALRQTVALYTNPNQYLDRIVPVAALLVEVSPIATTGPHLSSLFAQTQASPSLFASLHGYMLGHWPLGPAGGSPVDFQPLLTQSLSVLRQYSNTEGAGDILRSLDEMISRGLLPEENAERLVSSACEVWDSQREAASNVLLTTDVPPSPDLVADLATNIDPDSAEEVEALLGVWTHIATLFDVNDQLAVAEAIIAQPPVNGASLPDLGLRVWVDSQGDDVGELLEHLVLSADLNDAQRMRGWYQIDRLSNRLDPAFFQRVVPDVLATGSGDVARAVLGSRNEITERFVGPAARHHLMLLILKALVRAPEIGTKRQLTTWLSELGGEAVLKEAKNQQDIEVVDVDILLERFPSSRSLKNLRTRLAKD